jgi:hypothetical protein
VLVTENTSSSARGIFFWSVIKARSGQAKPISEDALFS